MKSRTTLKLDDVQPGMIVAEAVTDDGGRVLVPAGVALSEGMLQSLKRREVGAIWVETTIVDDPAAREAYRVQQVAKLDKLFRQAGDHLETRLLYQAILAFRMETRS